MAGNTEITEAAPAELVFKHGTRLYTSAELWPSPPPYGIVPVRDHDFVTRNDSDIMDYQTMTATLPSLLFYQVASPISCRLTETTTVRCTEVDTMDFHENACRNTWFDPQSR